MFRLIDSRLLRFLSIAVFLLGVQAFAQFEVSPDHVGDSTPQKQAAKKSANAKSHTGAAASPNQTVSALAAAKHKRAAHKRGHSASPTHTTGQTRAALSPR
jgi:hypothetical protein